MRPLSLALALVGLALVAGRARADFSYDVSVDTSNLVGLASPPGPFAIDVQLIQGDPANPMNTVTLTNFGFGGGAAGPPVDTNGGGSGDMTTGITLTETNVFNALRQEFTPGSVLTFLLTFTGNPPAGATPDQFSFQIDFTPPTGGGLIPFLTVAPDSVSLVSITFDSTTPVPQAYATDNTSGTGNPATIPAPTLTPRSVPEPSGLALMGLGGVCAAAMLRRSRRRVSARV